MSNVPRSVTLVFAALGGSLLGAGALSWLVRRRAVAKEPPSATFDEWIAAVVSWEEAEWKEAAREKAAPTKDAPPAAAVHDEPQ